MPRRSDSILRVGIVGAGIMGRGNATALSAERNVAITAVTSGRKESAQALAASIGGAEPPRCHDDFAALLADDQVDAVVLTTPDHLHGAMMVDAAAAGKHILVEKPFTTSLAEADAAVAAIRAAGVTAMCLFNHRWLPAYAQAKDLMPQVGEVAVGYARKDDTIYVPTEMLSWADRTTSAWFLSSHDIDLLSWLLDDRVERVYATARWGKLRAMGIETPDAIQIQATYSRGATVTFESAWINPNTFPTMVDSYVSVVGDAGVIQLDRQRENIQLSTDAGFQFPRNTLQRVVHGIPGGAYPEAIRHFVNCCLTGEAPLISIESSRDVTAVLEAAHESMRTRLPIDVPADRGGQG